MDQHKVQAVVDWPVPCTVCAVRAFLDLAGYYRRFIQDYGAIAEPLSWLLRKEGFKWTTEAEDTFRVLQLALTRTSMLQLPAFDRAFIVECDASGAGLGDGLVAFFSRKIASRHAKPAAHKRELIGLVQAMRHWRPYLWGREFTVRTDHFSLKYLLDQHLSTILQHQWASKLLDFDFKVEYKSGKANIIADALSRHDTEATGELRVACSTRRGASEQSRRAMEGGGRPDRDAWQNLCTGIFPKRITHPGKRARSQPRGHQEDTTSTLGRLPSAKCAHAGAGLRQVMCSLLAEQDRAIATSRVAPAPGPAIRCLG
jgi:hypothetical protein